MRILKPLLIGAIAIAAILAGLFAIVAVVIVGVLFFTVRRLLRRARTPGALSGRHAPSVAPSAAGETIDVVATEIPADRLMR